MPRLPKNFVAEWFGHVVWPASEVSDTPSAIADQRGERCPFLSNALARDTLCTKKAQINGNECRTGFCTASSPSSCEREDWLACPWRVFDARFSLIEDAIRRLYSIPDGDEIFVSPLTRFGSETAKLFVRALDERVPGTPRVFAFASNPPDLGGEVDIPETLRSPGNKVDVSIFEVVGTDGGVPRVGRSAIFEIQTADFHGSPLHAVARLRQHGPPGNHADEYHEDIASNAADLGEKVEGPNKANIFKRTIYQMILKIQMAKDPSCAGFAVVLPEPVWNSWSRHLGQPTLDPDPEDASVLRLRAPTAVHGAGAEPVVEPEPAWILVFKIDRSSTSSPRQLVITKRIATDSVALLYYAFDQAPAAAIAEGAVARFSATFQNRLSTHWSAPPPVTLDP